MDLNKIKKSIIKQTIDSLKDTPYKDLRFQEQEITENIIRPCFFFEFSSITPNAINCYTQEIVIDINIYYFSNSVTDLLDVQSLLNDTFKKCVIADQVNIPITDKEFRLNKKEKYFTLSLIDLTYLEETEEAGTNLMEEVEIN